MAIATWVQHVTVVYHRFFFYGVWFNLVAQRVSVVTATVGGSRRGVQGVRTPALLIRVPFLKVTMSINITENA